MYVFSRLMLTLSLLLAAAACSAQPIPEASDDQVEMVGQMPASEDLIAIPDSPWLIVSVRAFGPESPGRFELIDTGASASREFYPAGAEAPRPDRSAYPDCADGPPPLFHPHGVSVRRGSNGVHTLYTVHHGVRESVEIFELDATGKTPKIAWKGCVLTPPGVTGNAVAPMPEGFVMTQTQLPARGQTQAWIAKLQAGESVGEVLAWTPGDGWRTIEAGKDLMPNGIEVSPDGKWIYYADSERETFIRLSVGRSPEQKDVIETGFHADNVHWAPDGGLLVAGQVGKAQQVVECVYKMLDSVCGNTVVLRVDPVTLETRTLIDTDRYLRTSGAVQVGNSIWLGAIRGTVGSLPLPDAVTE